MSVSIRRSALSAVKFFLTVVCPLLAASTLSLVLPQPLATAGEKSDRLTIAAYTSKPHVLISSRPLIPRPVAVLVDNYSPDARPQSGLSAADLVFETVAEGGITRLMAVYTSHDASVVGPVRSTRMYFNAWAGGLGAILAHDGGNVDALQELPTLHGIYDIDADRHYATYWRNDLAFAPYNEYTNTRNLRATAARGAAKSAAGDMWRRKGDAPASARPFAFSVNIQFSYGDYNVSWRYDPTSNDYLRFAGGQPQLDAVTHKQIRARNLAVMLLNETGAYDPFTLFPIHLLTEGMGRALYFHDGQTVVGLWSKPTLQSPIKWLDRRNKPVALNRGNVWIEAVPVGNTVSTVAQSTPHSKPGTSLPCLPYCTR